MLNSLMKIYLIKIDEQTIADIKIARTEYASGERPYL